MAANYSVNKLSKFAEEHDLRVLNFRYLNESRSIALEVSVDGKDDQFMVLVMPSTSVKSAKARCVGAMVVEGAPKHSVEEDEPDMDQLFSR